jgi:hypothetical protein
MLKTDHGLNNMRSGTDRRNRRGINFRSLGFGGKREHIRRKEDMQKYFSVDRYSPSIFAAIIIILFLSVVDALLTLFLVENGAFEVNPIMAFYLKIGPYSFLAVKYGLTSIGVFVFLLLRNIYLRPLKMYAGTLLYIVIAVFATVVAWQLYLVSYIII